MVRRFQTAYADSLQKFKPVFLFQQIIKFGLAVAFGVACLRLILVQKGARQFAFKICVCALVYHLADAGVRLLCVHIMSGAQMEMTEHTKIENGKITAMDNKDAGDIHSGAALGASISLLISLMIKGVFYGWMMQALSGTTVRNIFGEDLYADFATQGSG